jgi:hypothetical protein
MTKNPTFLSWIHSKKRLIFFVLLFGIAAYFDNIWLIFIGFMVYAIINNPQAYKSSINFFALAIKNQWEKPNRKEPDKEDDKTLPGKRD